MLRISKSLLLFFYIASFACAFAAQNSKCGQASQAMPKEPPAKKTSKSSESGKATANAATKSSPAASRKPLMSNEEKSAIVEISDSAGGGGATGFIASINGRNFMVTNVHVLAMIENPEVKTMAGETLPIGKVFTAVGHDISIVPIQKLPPSCKPLLFADNIEKLVKPSDPVVVCGNSLAAKTMLETRGNVAAVGPELIELDCPFYRGNSGSPVFHLPTRKVIGVAAFVKVRRANTDNATAASRKNDKSAIKSDIRYFAFRMDTIKKWDSPRLSDLNKQALYFAEYEKKIAAIINFLNFRKKDESGDVKAAFYRELYDIIQDYRKDTDPGRHPSTRRRARKTMLERIARLCRIEASRLQSFAPLPSYEHYKDSLLSSYTHVAESLEKLTKNM